MLLHDEHPGAHAADRELLVSLDTGVVNSNVAAKRAQKRLDGSRLALGMDLASRPHPTHEPEFAGGGGNRVGVDGAGGESATGDR
jgi:hypothetical protein